jgi:hypothetical protein
MQQNETSIKTRWERLPLAIQILIVFAAVVASAIVLFALLGYHLANAIDAINAVKSKVGLCLSIRHRRAMPQLQSSGQFGESPPALQSLRSSGRHAALAEELERPPV